MKFSPTFQYINCIFRQYTRLSTFYYRLLLDGCPLIAIHKARYYKRGDGLALGPGPFATALEYAANTTATIVGKPEPSFFQEALRDMGVEPENAVLIGDVCCEVFFTLNDSLGYLMNQ